jgi:hypothetical protein
MGLLASTKFKPTLFVGLGGNGGKIVNLLAARLTRHPHWDRVASMTHFVAIDTNKDDLDKHRDISADCRFLVSSFDARNYVDRKKGLRELPEDPLVTQWVAKDYTFRSTQGAGAGQIRMESRLRLYYNLEEDRAAIRRKLNQLLQECTRRENPWRDNDDRVVRVMVYGSVAGGTGSGGFLPMGYLLRQMVLDAGWGRPSLTGVLTLPTAFLQYVKPQLHADILANGYAALKELEFLTRQLDYRGGLEEIEFHFDPGATDRSRQVVNERPFNLVYLIDRPDQVSIDKYEHAVSDACFLQIFSPLLGHQAGEYDNYEKHQKQLALGHFSVHYGAFGTALLHLPRRDLLRYASLRYVARAFREFLCFGGDDPQFRVPYGDPAFQRLDPLEKNRRIDGAFKSYVAWRAGVEEQADEKGAFSAIQVQSGKGGVDLNKVFLAKLKEIYGRLDELIDIPDVERQSINEGNPSLSRPIATLRKTYAESRARVRGEYLEAKLADLRTGRTLGGFFKEYEVNPIAQRLFLIKLMEQAFVVPFDDPAEGEFLKDEAGDKPDLDSQEVVQEISRLEQELTRSAGRGMVGRLFDSENKPFQAAKTRAAVKVNELSDAYRQDLRRYFWRTFEAELRKISEALLSAFRKVAEIADEAARQAEGESERFRRDPGAFPDSDVAQFYLDAEVLRDDRRKERLWGHFYLHHLDKSAYFDPAAIFPVVTQSFQPARDPDGAVRVRDASEIVRTVREKLLEDATRVFKKALDDLGLDLARGLDLEQRYIALLDDGQDLAALRQASKLDDTLRAVPSPRVRKGIEDRLKRVSDECVLLAHIDASRRDDPTVVPADVFYAGLHASFATDEDGSLKALLSSVVSRVNLVTGWEDKDSLVLYRALLGVPVYWFKNVQAELYPGYRKVRDDKQRSYPLHIEGTWESAPGLPDLDPLEIKRAEERAQVERAARNAREAQSTRVKSFTLCALFGQVTRDEQGYSWVFAGTKNRLGADRSSAFAAFEALDPMLREDLEKSAQSSWELGRAERAGRVKLREEVKVHEQRLTAAYAVAISEQKDSERRFLVDERAVVQGLAREIEG